MEIIKSNISGETRVIVKGKGWTAIGKVKPTEWVKTKTGWSKEALHAL